MALALYDKFPLPCGVAGSQPFSGQLSATSLKEYWKMDAASGNESGSLGAYLLTQAGTVGSVAGIITNARGVYSAANYFSKTDEAGLEFAGDATVACWAKWNSLTALSTVISKWGDSTHKSWRIINYSSSHWIGFVGSADGAAVVECHPAGDPTTGQWYFLAGRYDKTNGKIDFRVNTTDASQLNLAGGLFDSTAKLVVGNYDGGLDYPLDGWVDEISLWDRRLSDAELTTLYNGGAGLTY